MQYFDRLLELLKIEKEADKKSYEALLKNFSVYDRRENGLAWYPIAIRSVEPGRGDYLTIEIERTTNLDIIHQLRFGMTAALFSNHDAKNDRLEGTVSHISGNRLKLALRVDELPEWTRSGKLGLDAVFDENSYAEMEKALKQASTTSDQKNEGALIRTLIAEREAGFKPGVIVPPLPLNREQCLAVEKILSANELAIVHGPPGTGKTTTLVQAIKLLVQKENEKLLVVAPSNAAVDLLSEKLSDEGLNVLRVGNPARVSEKQISLTLDSRMSAHNSMKEIRRMRKQAAEYRDLAQKYKRNFGAAEREQRKALFTEARNIMKEVERTEQYIANDLVEKADVITSTLVGANHYTVRHLKYKTVVIDEAGQALEPACWIPILKAEKLVMAGDHCQLPPTIKSDEAAKMGLANTLLEKLVNAHPEAVVMLQEQYRMHQNIMQFSSARFYNNQLRAHGSVKAHVLFEGDSPLIFIDTAGCGFEEIIEGTRISNPEEAQLLLKHLHQFLHRPEMSEPATIALISPYRHQVEVLKEQFQSYKFSEDHQKNISINTIDSFQGQERDLVYISLTRSNSDSTIGFLSEIRRMNVAMTRARKKLVVIGDSATISQFPFYADFIAYAEKAGGYLSAWEIG